MNVCETATAVPNRVRWFTCVAGCAVLPVLTVVMVLQLKSALGPCWLGSNLDPQYCYLLNGLNIAQGFPPFLVEHPGTPVQTLAAAVIVVQHRLTGHTDLVADVLLRPEMYLSCINMTLVLLYAAALWGLGVVAVRVTNQWTAGWMVQLTPLLAVQCLIALGRVTPEPMLLFLTGILATAVVACLSPSSPRRETGVTVAVGAVAGIAVATKITALPLLLLPLLLFDGWRRRIVSLFAAALALLAATLPMWGEMGRSAGWLARLATHSGRYGLGETGFMVWSELPVRIAHLAGAEPVYAVVWIVSLIVVGSAIVDRCRKPMARLGRADRALGALVIVELLQFLMVVKHPYSPRYLVPGLGLSGLNLALVWISVRGRAATLPGGRWYGTVAVALLLALSCPRLGAVIGELAGERDDQLAVSRAGVPLQGKGRIVFCYRASSPVYALAFGNEWAGWRYSEPLHRMYPDALFHILSEAGVCYTFAGPLPPERVAALMKAAPLYLQGTRGPTAAGLTPVVRGVLEAIYRVGPVRAGE